MPPGPQLSHRPAHHRALTALTAALWLGCAATRGLAAADSSGVTAAVDSVRLQMNARQLEGAEARAQQLLAATEAHATARPLDLAEVLAVMVELCVARGEGAQPRTRELAERALAVTETAVGPDDPRTASRVEQLAHVARIGGDLAGARALYERALRIREQAQGPEHPEVAVTLGNLAYVIEASGDLEGAQVLYERALKIAEASRGPDHPDVAVALADLAGLLSAKGEYARARPMLERALAIREATLSPTDPDIVHSLTGLGILMRHTGDLAAARQYFERALRVREQGLGPEHPDLARYINNLANVLAESGELAAARPLFERALAIRTKALGPEHRDVASSSNNLASILLQTGDYAAARPLFERALAIWERVLGPEHPNVAICLDNLAHLSANEGDLEAARNLHIRALAIKERALGPEHPSVAVTVDSLADVLLEQGDLAQARVLHERALAIKEKALGPEHPEVARGLDNLGSTLYACGEYSRALSLHERALELREKTLGPQHPDLALSHRNCAVSQLATGDAATAFESALHAEQIGRDHLRLTSRSLGEREALRYAAVRYGGLDLALTLVSDPAVQLKPGAGPMAWDSAIRSRAVVLDEMGARHRGAFGSGDPAVDSLVADVQVAREQLASLTVRGVGDGAADEYRQQVEASTRAKEAAERMLADRSSGFQAELARAQIGLAEVLQALPPTAVLLGYCRFTAPSLQAPAAVTRTDPAAGTALYVVFVGRHGGADRSQVETVELGSAAVIDSLATEWRREAGRYAWEDRTGEREAACRRVGEALRRRVWDPIASHLGAADLVLVVPDGPLHLVNLAALPAGERGYLVEERLFHVLSAERDVVRTSSASGQGLLAVGDPDYDRAEGSSASAVPELLAMLSPFRGARPDCAAFEQLRFARLPQTRREIDDVHRLWKRAHRKEARVELTGRQANEARVKAELPGKRVVHLATHGFFLGDECPTTDTGGVTRHAGATAASATPLATASLENPLLLSGLALAGSNQRQQAVPGTEDGVLTAEEVASLDLRGVEWAVLSACETAAGDVRAGEGVFGLRRAFETAGAHTLIMSLWAVEDEAGRAWMDELYRARFADGLPTAAAVQQADLRILAMRRSKRLSTHPSVWAGFIAAGDWR